MIDQLLVIAGEVDVDRWCTRVLTPRPTGLSVDTVVAGDDSLDRKKPMGVDGRRQTMSCNADPRPAGGDRKSVV